MGPDPMQRELVLTLTGPDRIGIVEGVTRILLGRGGNVETSRMARLGGEFAILMLVSLPADQVESLETDLGGLVAQGYKVTTSAAHPAEARPGWVPFRIEVEGADHEGIIQEVARYLAGRGIHIETVDSETTAAPVSGSPLFTMTAEIAVPPELAAQGWQSGLDEISGRMNLEIRVSEIAD